MHDRTLFYGLPLHGEGTAEVESLRSYVERLSFAHCLRPRRLLETLLEQHPLTDLSGNLLQLVKKWDVHGLSRTGLELSRSLELATKQRLGAATLHRFSHVLSPLHLVRAAAGAVHCPVCVKDNGPTHGRLLWEVQCVTACPIHKVLLRPSTECGAPAEMRLPALGRPLLRSVCRMCGSIGFHCHAEPVAPASAEAVWVAKQVGQLLALHQEECKSVSLESTLQGIRDLVTQVYAGKTVVAALDAGLSRASVSTWLHGKFKPNLAHLVQLCLRVDARVVSVLQGKYECTSSFKGKGARVPLAARHYRRAPSSDDSLAAALRDAASEHPPPTVQTVCERIGISTRVARGRFPVETQLLADASTEHQRAGWETRYREAEAAYVQAALVIKARGEAVSWKRIQKEAGLAAFSQNSARVRALRSALQQTAAIAQHEGPRGLPA